MPKFVYSAKINPKQTIQGTLDAESQSEAVKKLFALGYFPLSVSSEVSFHQGAKFKRGIAKKELVDFTSQLSVLIGSGVHVLSALSLVNEQIHNKYFAAVIEEIRSRIKDGSSFSESLKGYPKIFSPLYVSMIYSGEASGNLKEVLERLSLFLEKEDEFRNGVISALAYPLFVLGVGVLTIVVLMTFVIPRMVLMFDEMNQSLPVPTQILISLSQFFAQYWWVILALLGVVWFSVKRTYQSSSGKLLADGYILQIPLFGTLLFKTEISRMLKVLSLLLESGVTVMPAIEIAAATISNSVLSKEIQSFQMKISQGRSLSQCFREAGHIPTLIPNIVAIGEESGTVDKSLARISADYEKEVDRYVKHFTRLLEPVIILLIGSVVGFIVISMLLPIFQINILVR